MPVGTLKGKEKLTMKPFDLKKKKIIPSGAGGAGSGFSSNPIPQDVRNVVEDSG